MGAKQFGARVARVEDPALLTGRARFVDDVKLRGMLHGCFLRSPHPHARIRKIDVSKALSLAGVKAILTHENCIVGDATASDCHWTAMTGAARYRSRVEW